MFHVCPTCWLEFFGLEAPTEAQFLWCNAHKEFLRIQRSNGWDLNQK